MGSGAIFNGTAIKLLRNILRFRDGVELSSTQVGYLNTITSDVQAQLDAKVDESREGANNGIATLDAGGKVPASQLPNSVMSYLGTWAASTNTPTLANGSGDAGDVYVASDAGTVDFGAGGITFAAGDWVVYNGSIWERSVNSNAVASVNGFTGAVSLDTDDVSEGSTNLYHSAARAQAAITGGASTIVTSNLTADRALASDGSGKVAVTSVTATELGHVSGVTSAIQTQLNAKQATITGAATTITSSDLTASRALASDGSGKVAVSATTSTELGYVSGVTSAIQTQLDAKQARSTLTTKGDLYVATASATTTRLAAGTNGLFLKADSTTSEGLVYASPSGTQAYRSVTTTDTPSATTDDNLILSGASFTVTLPTAVGNTGKIFTFLHKGTSHTQVYTIDGNSAETIDGAATYSLYTNDEMLKIISDGTNWIVLQHEAETPWEAVTVTGTWVTNATYTAFMKRIGDVAHYRVRVAATGTPTATSLFVTLNNSLTIDTAKLDGTTDAVALGTGIVDDATGNNHAISVRYQSTTQVAFAFHNVSSTVIVTTIDTTGPMTWASGDFLSAVFSVPISGWNN